MEVLCKPINLPASANVDLFDGLRWRLRALCRLLDVEKIEWISRTNNLFVILGFPVEMVYP